MNQIILSLGLVWLAWALPATAEEGFKDIAVATHKSTHKIDMLIGAGGNIGLSVSADGIVMVDDQYSPMAPKIRAAYLPNTHLHSDHTGGNAIFGIDLDAQWASLDKHFITEERWIRNLHRHYSSADSQ